MMTSKIEDRLRKNGVKIKKYYKWLRWSMIKIGICLNNICLLLRYNLLILHNKKRECVTSFPIKI